MNVLSLFDGISCGMVALERAGIPVENYYAYEINDDAINVSENNYPKIKHCGDVNTADFSKYRGIDLLIGGSPCQDFSTLSRTRNGLSGKKSGLFWEYVRALEESKPKYFLLENNVSMPKEAKKTISCILGVEPIMIDSALVSGQMRKRLYWTNIPNVCQPKDKFIFLKDIVKEEWLSEISPCDYVLKKLEDIKSKYGEIPEVFCPYNSTEITTKHYCLTAQGNSQTKSSTNIFYKSKKFYMPTSDFWEELQTLPIGYTRCLRGEGKRKVVIGNGWTVDVIAHIFGGLK